MTSLVVLGVRRLLTSSRRLATHILSGDSLTEEIQCQWRARIIAADKWGPKAFCCFPKLKMAKVHVCRGKHCLY